MFVVFRPYHVGWVQVLIVRKGVVQLLGKICYIVFCLSTKERFCIEDAEVVGVRVWATRPRVVTYAVT
jgi:hypothetical protein